MENLSRPAGSGVAIDLMGQSLILPGLTLKDIGVVENEIRMRRGDPMAVALPYMENAKIPLPLRERLLARAYDDAWRQDRIEIMQVIAFMLSPDGLPFAVWVALERGYPGRFAREQVTDAITNLSFSQLQRLIHAMEVASGMDAAGNSEGRAAEEAQTAGAEPPGPAFSAS